MLTEEIIKTILESNIPAEHKADIISKLKFTANQDKIIALLKIIGISAKIISLFKD